MFKSYYENWITQKPQGNEKYLFVVGYRNQAEQLALNGYRSIYITPEDEACFLFEEFKERLQNGGFSYDYVYVLCLSQRNSQIIENILTSKGIETVIDGWKVFDADKNLIVKKVEALIAGREARAADQTDPKPDNTLYYIDNLMTGEISRFKNDKKTGFSNLDALAGGLYSGLYVLAAISSLGKTSFALQLADQLAENGSEVIFFSMEQSRLELVSKSIARRTAQKEKPVTSLSIRKGYLPGQVLEAVQDYKKAVGDRISIVEGNFSCNISFIGEYIRQYINQNGTRPVVFIDYLQILQPAEDSRRQTTKETVDSTVTELKRISRDLDLTIFLISSVNRSNYLTPIDFESLKESGGIEFTADVIYGLQLQCLNDDLFTAEKKIKEKREKIKQAKAETPRKIELVCLKNRYGISNYSCYFNYYPANDLFTECNESDFFFTTPKAGRRL